MSTSDIVPVYLRRALGYPPEPKYPPGVRGLDGLKSFTIRRRLTEAFLLRNATSALKEVAAKMVLEARLAVGEAQFVDGEWRSWTEPLGDLVLELCILVEDETPARLLPTRFEGP